MAKSKKTKVHKKIDGQLLQMNKTFQNLKFKSYVAFYKSIVDQDRSAVVICNLKHEIIYMNPAAVSNYQKRGGDKLIGYYEKHEYRNPETMKLYDIYDGKDYQFYGHEAAGRVKAENDLYPGIETPIDLYDALSEIWCADTCAPRMREEWTPENKTLGQCSITAFLAQDIFGGEVYGLTTKSGGIHCYNVVDGVTFDLTSEQFEEDAATLVYVNNPAQDRESDYHFGKTEKRERYEYLKQKLQDRFK